MSYEKEKKIAGETEMLSSDEQNVSRLLSNLKRVDPPKDFDFHLKARLANASPGDYRPVRLFPVLKYALPLALFLLVGAGLILTNSYSSWNVPPVADVRQTLPSSLITDPPPDRKTSGAEIQPPISGSRMAEVPQNDRRFPVEPQNDPRPTRSVRPAFRNRPSGGSMDFGGGDKGGNTNVASVLQVDNSNRQNRERPSIPLQFREIFMSIGVDAAESGEKTWKVMGLRKDGIAERSGLKIGDLMEAIDDKPIDPLYKGSFSVKSISVRRDDKVVKIDIQPNKP